MNAAIRELIVRVRRARTIFRNLVASHPPVEAISSEIAWVDVVRCRLDALEALVQLIDANPDCRWHYRQDAYSQQEIGLSFAYIEAIGFVEPQHAVMFRLMLP